jgi:hypothetical protein
VKVVARARGDTTIIDALGTSSSRFELCHGYPTGYHPTPEICMTASGHDAVPTQSMRGVTRGTGEWHVITAIFDTRKSELFVDGGREATGKNVGNNRLDGLSIGCDHSGVFFLMGSVAEVRARVLNRRPIQPPAHPTAGPANPTSVPQPSRRTTCV